MSKGHNYKVVSSQEENYITEELLKDSSSRMRGVKKFNPFNDQHITGVAIQLLNIEFSIKENEEYGLETIVSYLKQSNKKVSVYYREHEFKERMARCSDIYDLYHPIRERMECSMDERITGEFIYSVFSDIEEDDLLYFLYFEFIEFLELYHRGIYQYMAAKGYIDDFLLENWH